MRRIILRIAVASSAMAALVGATATATATATASRSGKATTLSFSVDASVPPVSGRIPLGFTFSAPGFTFDSRAEAKFCKHDVALLNECPAKSRIGAGTLLVHVVSPKFTRDSSIPLDLYSQSRTGILAVAFIGGPKVVTGTVNTSGGVSLSVNLPQVPAFPGVTLTLERVNLKVGASRVVVTRKRHRVSGTRKFKTVVKRARYSLIHQPTTCTGSWSSVVILGFVDAPSAAVSAPIPCP